MRGDASTEFAKCADPSGELGRAHFGLEFSVGVAYRGGALTAETSETLSGDIQNLADVARVGAQQCLQLVLLWSRHEPHRVGESCVVARAATLGRGAADTAGDPPRVEFSRQRPGVNEPTGCLTAPTLSRRQWRLEPVRDQLKLTNLGKRDLLHNGVARAACTAKVGDTVAIEGVVSFLVVHRSRLFAGEVREDFEFGQPDPDGLVGETPELWELRADVARLGLCRAHVVVFGDSGSGKELCARAIHRASPRRVATLVSRNAATIPQGLVEAELFGNAQNYPHAGLPARSGLVGQADRGTLFLDEVGELPEHQQANLLRVLDAGEYQRLGEDRLRRSDLRVIAATNRSPEALKPDFLARFSERVQVPGLNQRRADVPLLARGILKRLAQEDPNGGELALDQTLTDALVRHQYQLHHRELERILRLASRHAVSGELVACPEVLAELDLPVAAEVASEAAVRQVLAECKTATEAAKRLGLPSRFALYRLMKKLGIESDTS